MDEASAGGWCDAALTGSGGVALLLVRPQPVSLAGGVGWRARPWQRAQPAAAAAPLTRGGRCGVRLPCTGAPGVRSKRSVLAAIAALLVVALLAAPAATIATAATAHARHQGGRRRSASACSHGRGEGQHAAAARTHAISPTDKLSSGSLVTAGLCCSTHKHCQHQSLPAPIKCSPAAATAAAEATAVGLAAAKAALTTEAALQKGVMKRHMSGGRGVLLQEAAGKGRQQAAARAVLAAPLTRHTRMRQLQHAPGRTGGGGRPQGERRWGPSR